MIGKLLKQLSDLKLGDSVILNGIELVRSTEDKGYDFEENFWEFQFCISEVKENPDYLARVYVSLKEDVIDGREVHVTDKYIRAILIKNPEFTYEPIDLE